MIKSGTLAEHHVMLELLKNNIEAYFALKKNQEDYDITAIINEKIIRIQVKSTQLNNKCTNNTVKIGNLLFDYLVVVVYEDIVPRFFILSREDVKNIKGKNKQLSISQNNLKSYTIKREYLEFENKWNKLTK